MICTYNNDGRVDSNGGYVTLDESVRKHLRREHLARSTFQTEKAGSPENGRGGTLFIDSTKLLTRFIHM